MKNPDLISKRIMVAAMSICAVLISVSLLFWSISTVEKANAGTGNSFKPAQPVYYLYPMGMSDGYVYYIYDGGGAWTFEKIEASKAVAADWVK
ncbi:MAG TPA: hypothetical protein PKW80_12430 [Bacteroidales bacterium]|nr:hypothetical protein [Bacteroidales bacterium]